MTTLKQRIVVVYMFDWESYFLVIYKFSPPNRFKAKTSCGTIAFVEEWNHFGVRIFRDRGKIVTLQRIESREWYSHRRITTVVPPGTTLIKSSVMLWRPKECHILIVSRVSTNLGTVHVDVRRAWTLRTKTLQDSFRYPQRSVGFRHRPTPIDRLYTLKSIVHNSRYPLILLNTNNLLLSLYC